MNYKNWIVPMIVLSIFTGNYIAKKLQKMRNSSPSNGYSICFIILLSASIFARSTLAGFFFYFAFFHIIYDFIIKIFFKTDEKIKKIIKNPTVIIFLISALLTIYGRINIQNVVQKDVTITISHPQKTKVTIGLVTDVHLGTVNDKNDLDKLVKKANEMNTDIFVLGGDIFDEFTKESQKEEAYQKLSTIKTNYGIYYIEGNHDLLNDETRKKWEANRVRVLTDEVVEIPGILNIIGRKDARNNKLGKKRKTLEELVEKTNRALPIILLDHQPKEYEKAKELGIICVLSGHTHEGQIMPLNFFLKHGVKKEEHFYSIISSGYSGFGIPIRTAGHSDIIKINLISE